MSLFFLSCSCLAEEKAWLIFHRGKKEEGKKKKRFPPAPPSPSFRLDGSFSSKWTLTRRSGTHRGKLPPERRWRSVNIGNDSQGFAVRISYHTLLCPSSKRKPRYPSSRVNGDRWFVVSLWTLRFSSFLEPQPFNESCFVCFVVCCRSFDCLAGLTQGISQPRKQSKKSLSYVCFYHVVLFVLPSVGNSLTEVCSFFPPSVTRERANTAGSIHAWIFFLKKN